MNFDGGKLGYMAGDGVWGFEIMMETLLWQV